MALIGQTRLNRTFMELKSGDIHLLVRAVGS